LSLLRDVFGIDLSVCAFIEHPTLADFALAVLGKQAERGGHDLVDSLANLEQLPESEARRQISDSGESEHDRSLLSRNS